jgi:hypothetical protein
MEKISRDMNVVNISVWNRNSLYFDPDMKI